jgi:hypothetical protein
MEMFIRLVSLCVIGLVALGLVACGTAPTPTPAATQPPIVQTVIITATPQPVTATPLPQPTATAVVPTVAITPTVPPATTAPTKAAVVATARPAPTRTPTKPAVAPSATAIPIKYPGVRLVEPNYDLDKGVKDERHFPADALIFKWQGIPGLGGDECYLVTVSFEPGARDNFLTGCGNVFPDGLDIGKNLAWFKLNRPDQAGPNYSSLLPQQGEFWAYWSVIVVKNMGTKPDGKPLTAPLSPDSGRYKFLMKGN